MKISLLISSLPSQSTTRKNANLAFIKVKWCSNLRDGVYLLPEAHSEKFESVVHDHLNEHGHAYIFQTEPPAHLDLAQLFDRTGEYEELRTEISQIQNTLEENKKKEHLKQIRKLRKTSIH